MSDGAFQILALAGLLLVIVAVGSVLASWAWRMRRAGVDFTPGAYASGPPSGSGAVPAADPGGYAPMASGPSHAAPQSAPQPYIPQPIAPPPVAPEPVVGPRPLYPQPSYPQPLYPQPLYPQPMYPPPAYQQAAYQEAAYRAAHRVDEPHHPQSWPVPDDATAGGRHHAPDPPPDWPPYQQ